MSANYRELLEPQYLARRYPRLCVSNSLPTGAAQHRFSGPHEDPQVEPEAPVFYIRDIEAHLPLGRGVLAGANLPEIVEA